MDDTSSSLSKDAFKKNMEKDEQTLHNIEQLQAMEKELYSKLEVDAANNTINSHLSKADQDATIKKINELSQLRIGLFKTLSNTYDSLQNSVANSRVNLVDQLTAVGIVESELNNAKSQLNQLKNIKNNKMRMVEINTYYGKQYRAQSSAIKKLIFICLPVLVLAILKKKGLIPPFIPDSVVYLIAGLILLFGGVSFIRTLFDIYSRDNMNFDEYNWNFNPKTANSGNYDYTKIVVPSNNFPNDLCNAMGFGCVDSNCCSEGMTYDKEKNKCIQNGMKEMFVTGQLSKNRSDYIEATDRVYMGNNAGTIQPYSEGVQFAAVSF